MTGPNEQHVYQLTDHRNLYVHGIFDTLEGAQAGALERLDAEPDFYGRMQINRIPLNRLGCYTEDFDVVWESEADVSITTSTTTTTTDMEVDYVSSQ